MLSLKKLEGKMKKPAKDKKTKKAKQTLKKAKKDPGPSIEKLAHRESKKSEVRRQALERREVYLFSLRQGCKEREKPL
jgi:hypothetical protein